MYAVTANILIVLKFVCEPTTGNGSHSWADYKAGSVSITAHIFNTCPLVHTLMRLHTVPRNGQSKAVQQVPRSVSENSSTCAKSTQTGRTNSREGHRVEFI